MDFTFYRTKTRMPLRLGLLQNTVFRIRIRIRGSASGLMDPDPGPVLDTDPDPDPYPDRTEIISV